MHNPKKSSFFRRKQNFTRRKTETRDPRLPAARSRPIRRDPRVTRHRTGRIRTSSFHPPDLLMSRLFQERTGAMALFLPISAATGSQWTTRSKTRTDGRCHVTGDRSSFDDGREKRLWVQATSSLSLSFSALLWTSRFLLSVWWSCTQSYSDPIECGV